MNIALCHFRVGETDGVSLEMEKWKTVLENLGHNVYYLAGSSGNTEAFIIPELHYKNPENLKFIENSFIQLRDYTELELQKVFEVYKNKTAEKLERFIKDYKIEILIPNNILSRGWNIPVAMAFVEVVEKLKIKCFAHHHDFYWERKKFIEGSCSFVDKCLSKYFPPKNDNLIKHIVINEIAREELKRKKNIESTIIPNVFNYSGSLWKIDDYNKDFREAVGINQNDVLVLQATRIVERKAIELSIDVVSELQKEKNRKTLYARELYDGKIFGRKNKIILFLAGLHEFSSKYIEYLKEKAKQKEVNIVFKNEIIEDVRCSKNGRKCYSLWDAFANSDLVTYPSIYEGWGNQFLETIFAKKPVVVYEYPVYLTDIKRYGFDIISLGAAHTIGENNLVEVDDNIIVKAAEKTLDMLIDKEKRNCTVNHNFNIALTNFSYESLKSILSEIIQF
ncbi:MAG: glycosyltransferase family 4 protein [Victivallales bacterium]|nr:glycosyltransferase family 4 protein [Victivallales bacterium]